MTTIFLVIVKIGTFVVAELLFFLADWQWRDALPVLTCFTIFTLDTTMTTVMFVIVQICTFVVAERFVLLALRLAYTVFACLTPFAFVAA